MVVNKVDRKDARPAEVVEEIADLFLELAQDADQLAYPVIYTIARDGRAGLTPDALAPDLGPLFAAILQHVPPPVVDPDGPLQLLVSALDYDPHRGRIGIGRLVRGRLVRGQQVRCLGAATGENVLRRPGPPADRAVPLPGPRTAGGGPGRGRRHRRRGRHPRASPSATPSPTPSTRRPSPAWPSPSRRCS